MYDVVIIGGGPAGISAGTILQRKGYKTCIIDSQVFPREKLCAGVLTVKTIDLIKKIFPRMNIDELDIKFIEKMSVQYKKRNIGDYYLENKHGVVDRKIFDAKLLNYYQRVGGKLIDGEKKYRVIYERSTIELSNGRLVRYKCLIGADGINSKIRSYVQHKWNAGILCFEKFIPNESDEDVINITFGEVLGGYCWRIPGKERIGIGLGEFYLRGSHRNVNKYKRYFKSQGITKVDDIKGAFVSYGGFVRFPLKNNVLLVGDAAGLVDAMTGEGIYFAMESGKQAAFAIIDYLENNKPLFGYVLRLNKIHNRIREQNVYNKMLFVPGLQALSVNYMAKNQKFVQRVLDKTIAEYSTGYTYEIIRSLLC